VTAPPFAYFGGKTTAAARIVDHLPPHQHYVEPFAGSLAVLFAKPRSRMETVNDLDHEIVTFWRLLRDRPDELIRACALTPHSRVEYELADERPNSLSDIERARRVWVRLSQGRASGLLRTGWRHYITTAGSKASMPAYLNAYVDRMADCAARLSGVTLEHRPALDLIGRYGDASDVCLYVDPPYLGSTRGQTDRYRHEMRDEESHRELAYALHRCRATVVLSGYASDLYDLDLYPDWHRTAFLATSQGGQEGSPRIEVLWSNRAASSPTLFDHAPDRIDPC
jgi:DNA adenine methylase